MLILETTSDVLRLVTTQAIAIDVVACYVSIENETNAVNDRRTLTAVVAATTTTVLASPATGNRHIVRALSIHNKDATTTQGVTVQLYDGANAFDILDVQLAPGATLFYHGANEWSVKDGFGRLLERNDNTQTAAVNAFNLVVLGADVTNNNAVANTIQDVTGLSLAVVTGETYWFRFVIQYTAAATGTGSRWSISGPGAPTALRYRSEYSLTATTRTLNEGLAAYDVPAASNATSAATAANVAVVEGFITPSADGTLIARFASEAAGSAIIARAGSICQWVRVL